MKKIFDKVREWTGKQIPDKAIEMVLEVFAESDIYFPSDFTISLTKEQMQDAKKANIELNEKTKALFMELNHDGWGKDETANQNIATIIFGLVLTANGETLSKEVKTKVKVSDAYKGGKEDVDFAKGIEYPISLKRTNDVKEYLDTKVSHPFPEVMFEDIRHTKKFTDIPWGVLTHLVSYYHAHNGDVTAKDMLGYVKRKMLKEVPLNKLGANVKTINDYIDQIADVGSLMYLGDKYPKFTEVIQGKEHGDVTLKITNEKLAKSNKEFIKEVKSLAKHYTQNADYETPDVSPSGEKAKNGANIKGVGHTYENRGDWKRDLQIHDALMSGEGDDIKFLQGKIKYKQEGEHLVAYLGSLKIGYWDYGLNEGYIYHDKFKNGGNLDGETDVTTKQFNIYFQKNYGFISHSLSNKEVQKFLDQDVIKRVSLPKKADYFQDYILANGLQDDIQLEKGAKIPQFEKLPKNRQANKKYKYFAVGKSDGKIVDGWEIVSDVESLKYYAKLDLKDNDYNPKDFNIVSKESIMKKGINPFDFNNWRKIDYSNDVPYEPKAKNGANIKVSETLKKGNWDSKGTWLEIGYDFERGLTLKQREDYVTTKEVFNDLKLNGLKLHNDYLRKDGKIKLYDSVCITTMISDHHSDPSQVWMRTGRVISINSKTAQVDDWGNGRWKVEVKVKDLMPYISQTEYFGKPKAWGTAGGDYYSEGGNLNEFNYTIGGL